MIKLILEELKNGNPEIPVMFKELEAKWQKVFENLDRISEDELAEQLSSIQFQVEHVCGARNLGKAIMPWSAFAHFYSTQFGYEDEEGNRDNGYRALKLSRAFAKSHCSVEVKYGARAAGEVYSISDFEQQADD